MVIGMLNSILLPHPYPSRGNLYILEQYTANSNHSFIRSFLQCLESLTDFDQYRCFGIARIEASYPFAIFQYCDFG